MCSSDLTAIDFGEIAWGASASATVTITNVGDDTLLLDGLSLDVDDSEITMTAVTSPVVPPGGMVDTVVTWTPYAAGEMADTLLIDSDDPDEARVEVPLSGSVPHGEIAIDPETWDFGTLAVGATDTVMITVSNVGDGPLTVSDWT